MRKRLIEKFTKSKEGSLGYTMTELLVVIAIIAVVVAIAIPSVIAISRALKFKRLNDHAKSIFLAAQQNLTEMRSDGGLLPLQAAGGSVLTNIAGFPDEYKAEYVYTTQGTTAFELILPAGSVDNTVRAEQIIIEYNPITGNVYSVFYSEEDESILSGYQSQEGLPREDRAARKEMMLGYYDGSGLNSSQLELEKTQASVEFINGEEGIVRVLVPVPDDFFSSVDKFAQALEINLTVTGEYSMVKVAENPPAEGETAPEISFPLTIKDTSSGLGANCYVEYGNTIVVEYPIDSLVNYGSFANYASGTQKGSANEGSLTKLMNETAFSVLPGENITIQADVTVDTVISEVQVKVDSGILSGINPMFEYLQPSGSGGYVLAVSNGRNLQNLNALAPTIAKQVDSVVFTSDIYWNDTVSYYNSTYGNGSGSFANAASENPARALPYFVPIHHEDLFGTATFIYPGEDDEGLGGILEALREFFEKINEVVFGGFINKKVPTLTDEMDAVLQNKDPDFGHATIQGNGHKVYNLNIDSNRYTVPNDGTFYATGTYQEIDYYFTGLFGYVNTPIESLHVVNPIIKGHAFENNNNPATGALVGAAGYNTLITDCSVYIDKNAAGYVAQYLGHAAFNASAAQTWYGVSGEGAVGGLVGYAKSHHSVTGDLTNNKAHLAFSGCFAAVPVSGNMRTSTAKDYGYSNGVGAFIGNSQLTNFYNCYASGDVLANNCVVNKTDLGSLTDTVLSLFGIKLDLLYNGRTSWGAGGFVGTSHGTRYTNCFATGDVNATAASSIAKGAGGFVGFMSLDETSAYGNEATDTQIAQKTVMTECYATGLAATNGSYYENFSGANGRIVFNFDQVSTYVVGDYYRLYAPYYADFGKAPQYGNSTYIYRDTYYLNYGDRVASSTQDNSSSCADPVSYEILQNLIGAHTWNSTWSQARLETLKKTSVTNSIFDLIFGANYESKYFSNISGLSDIYLGLYAEGYSASEWESATAATTHPYTVSAGGAVYPFTKLTGMDYYGDWPSKPSNIGMAYYEIYDGTDNTTYYVFDKERDTDTRLKLKDGENVVVAKDGYAIFSASSTPLTVTVGGISDTLTASGDYFKIEGKEYYSFILSDTLMAAMPANNEFYVQVTAKHDDSTTYTMYFNPGVALSHVNPMNGATAATKPDAAPKTIYVRSARQFKAIATLDAFWGDGYSYIQQLNIDATKYDNWGTAANAAKRQVGSIGNATKPFNASYSAGYTTVGDVAKQYAISGFQFADNASGFFGVIGSSGSVENLIVNCGAVTVGDTTVSDVAVLAGRNMGIISNVDLTITGAVTLTSQDNAGLLAGYSSGIIRNCAVTAGAVTLNAENGGGLIGSAVGTQSAKTTVSGCALTLTGNLTVNAAENAGGLIGSANYLTLAATEPLVTLTNMTAEAGYAGGLAGYMENTEIKITDAANAVTVTVTSVKNETGYAAGALGGGKTVTLNSVDINAGTIEGKVAAGFLGVGTDVDAAYCDVVITNSIKGTEMAAGVAGSIGAQSVFGYVPVTLTNATVEASAGDAAGYAVEIAKEANVMNSSVTLGGTAKIKASGSAAGYACAVAGYVGNSTGSSVLSSVVGKGAISGANAAGFACDITGQVAGGFVTPALDSTKYLGNSNNNLTVTGTTSAAGFALTVGADATVTNCYALNSVSGTAASGFVGSNKGTISGCMANVTISGGYAFIVSNEGTVTRCYGWYGDGDSNATTTVATVDGKCFSAYFADLDPADKEGSIVTLYAADGKMQVMTATELQGAASTLAGESYKWYSSGYNSYPYTDNAAMSKYLYPMLRDHFGDWVTPPQYAYGVAYYETYEVTNTTTDAEGNTTSGTETVVKLHMVDLSQSSITEEGSVGKNANYSDTFNNEGTIVKSGYAVFSKSGTNVLSSLAGDKIEGLSYTLSLNAEKSVTYDFYELKADSATNGVVTIGATAVSSTTATVQTWFADAINVTDNTYQVRTPEQLAKIGAVSANFNQTHDIAVTDFTTAALGSGYTYNGNDLKLSVSAQTATWLSNVGGTVQNLKLAVSGGVNAPVFGTISNGASVTLSGLTVDTIGADGALAETVSGTMTVPAISPAAVNGKLFGDSTGTIKTGAITVNGNAATLFSKVVNAETGAITVNGNVTGKVFGETTGTVKTGAISVTGTAAQIFGNVSGTGVTVTGTITTGDLTGNAIGAVSANLTVGGISVGNVPAGKYVITSISGGTVDLGAVSTQMVGSTVTTGEGESATTTINSANIFGNISGGSVTVASVNTNGQNVYGNVFGDVGAQLTVSNDITTGAVTSVFGNITGGTGVTVSGKITAGTVGTQVFGTVGAPVTITNGIETGAASKIFGDVSANVTTGSIKTGAVTNVFGNITSGATVTTGNVTVASLSGQLAGSVSGTLQGSAAGTAINIGENGTADLTKNLVGTVSGTLKNYAISAMNITASVIPDLDGTVQNVSVTADSATLSAPVLVADNDGTITGCSVTVTTVNAAGAAAPYGVLANEVVKDKSVTDSIVMVDTLTIDGNTGNFGALVGTNAGTLTGNTVDSKTADKSMAVNITGVNSKNPVVGGLVGTNDAAGTITGGTVDVTVTYAQSNQTDSQGNVTATDTGATIGGLVGENKGTIGAAGTATTVKGAVNLTKLSDGKTRSYIIGGAVGKDAGTTNKPATYTNVTATVTIGEAWAGSKLVNSSVAKYVAETDAQALAAICPAGFGPVGKFVGYVDNGTFTNCTAVGSGTTKVYQFLGEIKPSVADLKQDSLYRSTAEYKDSFTLNSATDLCAPGEAMVWAEWCENVLKAGADYRVFDATLTNCSFDLPTGETANQVYTANYDFYKHDDSKYTEVKLYKSGTKVENNITFTSSNQTYQNLYDTYKPDSENGTNTVVTDWYYNDNGTYKRVTIEVKREQSSFLGSKYESKRTVTVKFGSSSVSKSIEWMFSWSSWSGSVTMWSIDESVDSNATYVLLSEDGTKMMAVVDGAATSVAASTSFKESGGYLWKRANGAFTSATHDVTLAATLNLAADSYNSTTQAYVIDGVSYYLHTYTEASHGYTATFVPSGERNLVCSYVVTKSAVASISDEIDNPTGTSGGDTQNS